MNRESKSFDQYTPRTRMIQSTQAHEFSLLGAGMASNRRFSAFLSSSDEPEVKCLDSEWVKLFSNAIVPTGKLLPQDPAKRTKEMLLRLSTSMTHGSILTSDIYVKKEVWQMSLYDQSTFPLDNIVIKCNILSSIISLFEEKDVETIRKSLAYLEKLVKITTRKEEEPVVKEKGVLSRITVREKRDENGSAHKRADLQEMEQYKALIVELSNIVKEVVWVGRNCIKTDDFSPCEDALISFIDKYVIKFLIDDAVILVHKYVKNVLSVNV